MRVFRFASLLSWFALGLSFSLALSLAGCGGGAPQGFSLVAAPNALVLSNGGSSQTLTMSLQPVAGFQGEVAVSVSGLPKGVTATPATILLTPGQLGQWTLVAAGAAVNTSTLTVTGTSGAISSSTTVSLAVAAGQANAVLSASSYAFGGNLVGASLTKSVVKVTNTGEGPLTLKPTLSGDASYALVPQDSCGATLAAGASCTQTVSYTPTVASGTATQTAVLDFGFGNVPTGTAAKVSLTGRSAVLPAGVVTSTSNPQVAQYTMTLPFPGSITVNFGTDTGYGRATWTQTTTTSEQSVIMLVAGMLPNTVYHLQAQCQMANGTVVKDADHTFTTGQSLAPPSLAVTTTPGLTPQPGVEQLTFVNGVHGLAVTDLQGNVLWSYVPPNQNGIYYVQDGKLLPNGHFLVAVSAGSSYELYVPGVAQQAFVVTREIDLAGNIVREIGVADLNDELATAGYHLTLQSFHHSVTPLANGHWLVLANTFQPFTDLPGYPGVTNVLGDVIVDLDTNLRPVWVWNSFDHLDVNRHPWLFPDWTHTNDILYSPSDGNLMVSMRHQNWVLKLDYRDGAGTGNVLWHLGEGGDFALAGGTDPTDWAYAQHYPSLFSANSAGVFSLGMMDNGDDRQFPTGVACGTDGEPACSYSTVPLFQVDETAKTATLVFHQVLPPTLFSAWGGNTELLDNGHIEYDLAGIASGLSDVFEVTDGSTPQTVWHLHSTSGNLYRAFRIPSLYPGVQWK